MNSRFEALLVLLLLVGAAACAGSSETAAGDEGGECYANGTCNAGLSCSSNVCMSRAADSDKGLDALSGHAGEDGDTGSRQTDGGANTDDDGKAVGGDGGQASAGATATGTIGAPCKADGTCESGLDCLAPVLASKSERYCAPKCEEFADCSAFGATSYQLSGVPDTFTPFLGDPTPSAWPEGVLSRGFVCGHPPGVTSGPKHCMFGCPDFSAIASDEKGELTSCLCLPGYSANEEKTGCKFGTTHQCSIFTTTNEATQKLLESHGIQVQKTACDACNSDMTATNALGCHSGAFFCDVRTTGLNGDCVETLTRSQFNQCIEQKTNFSCNCDPVCTSDYDLCNIETSCDCTEAPAGAAPTCDDPDGSNTGMNTESGGQAGGGSGAGGGTDADEDAGV